MKLINQTQIRAACYLLAAFLISMIRPHNAEAYVVTDIAALYSKGQVFITWTNPTATGLKYKVYRSTSKFTSASQLTSDKLLGFVEDNSGKNIHLSKIMGHDVFFKTRDNGDPLTSKQVLYVVTCTKDAKYYYAVTVTKISGGSETKTITLGENSLSNPISESLE